MEITFSLPEQAAHTLQEVITAGMTNFGHFYLDKEKDIIVDLHMEGETLSYVLGGICLLAAVVWFCVWYRKEKNINN